ncbi:annexin B9 isoform X1 [Fopius arisanus]|uniref:Annexin n=1 Tax=Fopius arisanus TaxID=64838 RepID=A0A9R1T9R2_9HYME|nr:PREDICTED: annexin B9-like isoform X1 [Fopius arisanus]
MSYGYQGPPVMPFPGKKPPTSFGVPPGTPSAPSAMPHPDTNYGFNAPPTSFGMPQPYSPYPPQPQYSPYPQPQSSPYSQPQPSPYSQPQPSPYSQSQPSPYPQPRPSPYSEPQPSPYSQPQSSPYSQPQPSPYLRPQSSPYPPPQSSPGPQPQSSPYPQPGGHVQPASYSHQPSPYPPQSSPYPHCPPGSMNPHPQSVNSSTNYPGGACPGGQRPGQYPQLHDTKLHSMTYHTGPTPRKAPFSIKLSPTVVPSSDFDPRTDAEVLRKAMKGFGTDEKAIIGVLSYRNNMQRQEIAVQFKTLYGKDLIKDLKSELSGNFEDLVVAMMTPLPQYYAKELHDAMSGIGTEECVLIEVMCTMSNHEIRVIRQAYETMYGQSLEDALRDDTSGNFKRLMVSLSCGNRDESFDVNPAAAAEDARRLLQAGELQFGTDESVFNEILVQRNIPQLKQIFLEYQNITGHTIHDALENEFSGDIKKGLLAIVKCVGNRAGFFAEQLYKSMKGMGTDDRRLIRLVVTRSEIDMGEIKQEFSRIYGQSLEDFISGDCSGHYKKCLLALIS